eukprot:9940856-Alexandrium_andersonii.AAC.1
MALIRCQTIPCKYRYADTPIRRYADTEPRITRLFCSMDRLATLKTSNLWEASLVAQHPGCNWWQLHNRFR